MERWPIPAEWLSERADFAQEELAHTENGIAFGRLNDEWKELREARRAGDQLWRYDSRESWGMAGYVLVRDCEIVYNLITVQYE